MLIIDPHVHVGHDTTWDSNRTEDEIIMKMNEVGIEAAIVQPAQFVTFDDYCNCHNRIHDFHLKHPHRIFGMFSLNPHYDEDLYRKEAHRCVDKLGFVAMKLTPLTHIMSGSVRRSRLAFEVARELNVPLMIHQGTGLPWSSAITFYDLIKEFSDVSIVLAHCGTYENEEEDIFVAKKCENVFLELSVRTPNMQNIKYFAQEIGSHRMMFASDSPDEMAHVKWEIENCGLSEKEITDILGQTAKKVFKLGGKIELE